jgi:hypothetical protein
MAVREETIADEVTMRDPFKGLSGRLLVWLSDRLDVRES